MGVEVKVGKDGNLYGTLSTKISIAETLYNNLVDLENGSEEDVPTPETQSADENVNEEELDLSKFVKEIIDGEVYYSYTYVEDNLTLQELVDKLYEFELQEGIKMFKPGVAIRGDKGIYEFSATTEVISDENVADDESIDLGEDWLTLTLTVKMPGEVVETTGEIVGDKKDGTIRFTIKDFTTPHELTVKTEEIANLLPLIILWTVGLIAIAFCLTMFFRDRKKINKERERLMKTGRDTTPLKEVEEKKNEEMTEGLEPEKE